MTITEALAEIKTIGKRIQAKRESVGQYLVRQERLKDPLEKEGGSRQFIARERQAIHDLEERVIALRRAIQRVNHEATITVQGHTRTIQDWLTWRREIADGRKRFLATMRDSIRGVRQQAQQKGLAIVTTGAAASPDDVLVNVDEGDLATDIERIELVLGDLDGQLSLKNATVAITP